jgi:Tfp pilus assembly protein PilX
MRNFSNLIRVRLNPPAKSHDLKGSVLYLVLTIILLVVILASIIISVSTSSVVLTQHQIHRIQAYYAAQAAVNLALEHIRAGTWDTGSYSLCSDGSCTENDPDIPYQVDISVGAAGSGLDGTRSVTASVTYNP